ncbi:M48 family metallopeptidase [Motilimonas sp. KMU-193]|uniref:M48 family metallopeptidase n=1 Tax=Motilimonas sp. KMU-193 TaxID=3388668 RepID=UPI00396B134A
MSQASNNVFEDAVIAAERQVMNSERGYKLRLFAFAMFGYLVIFSALALFLGIIGGLIGLALFSTGVFILLLKTKVIFAAIPAAWILGKSLWIKFDAPKGYELTRKQCPVFFDQLNQLRKQLKTPKIHQVIVEKRHNAAILQTPLLGIFGWQKNTLFIGLELLMVMTPAQAKAVLAHELGHLSGKHSQFAGWIYRVRASWLKIMHAFEYQDSWGAKMMASFFNWYAPRFHAYSFVLARTNEYEADRIAAKLTSRQDMADALITSHVIADYLESHYWDAFFNQADSQPEPKHMPWRGFADFLTDNEQAKADLRAELVTALEVKTDYADSHPSLTDRIKALDVEPKLPEPAKQYAAQVWLGSFFDTLVNDFDHAWYQAMRQRWHHRFEYIKEQKAKLSQLLKIEPTDLDDEQLWQKACLLEEIHSLKHAAKSYFIYYQRQPNQAKAAYALARVCYQQQKDKIIDLLTKSAKDPDFALASCEMAWHYLNKQGKATEAQAWHQRYCYEYQQLEQRWQAINYLNYDDALQPPSEQDEQAVYLVKRLRQHRLVKHAFVAEKVVPDAQNKAPFIVTVELKGWFGDETKARKLEEWLNQQIDRTVYVFVRSGEEELMANEVLKHGVRIK